MKHLMTMIGVSLCVGIFATSARADVARIREKALELEQALVAQRFAIEVKGKKADYERVYMNFAFLLKESQIKEVTKAGDERLAMFLQECKNNLELASYVDDLHNKQATDTVDFEGVEKTQGELLDMLSQTEEAASRRKIYSSLKQSFELDGIFQNQIVTRRIELAQATGYSDYADYYGRREHIDLDVVVEEARLFLDESQSLYDTVFAVVAQDRLGVEARKIKFLDFPRILRAETGAPAVELFNSVVTALGVPGLFSGATFDVKPRPRRIPGAFSYPLTIPGEIMVGITPTGTINDLYLGLYALGESGLFSLSNQTVFEQAYLVPQASRATMGFLVRTAGDLNDAVPHEAHIIFSRLLEARMLAAQTIYEVALYRGDPTADDIFKAVMREASGSRLSSSDVKRRFEYATSLESVARFQGLMAAHTACRRLKEDVGDDWYTGGKVGKTLVAWYNLGGTLTLKTILDGDAPSRAALLEGIQSLN